MGWPRRRCSPYGHPQRLHLRSRTETRWPWGATTCEVWWALEPGVALPCREQGKCGTLPSISSQGATYMIGVGDCSYSLVVALSMGPEACNLSSSKALKNTRHALMSLGPCVQLGFLGGLPFWGHKRHLKNSWGRACHASSKDISEGSSMPNG